ncbi:MAG TPA: heat-inducible transcription repressor HrcA [Dehalococcoidia bacterium]|jgi:heat-inducible transcriptional repressor|nr:heat-inducible transcription repressor HrcA [Dehalococcoidia bacterium]
MDTLTERRAAILSLVVDEYIRTAEPVSSKFLADMSGLSVSPATVRNEFALLEANGLLTHPHTSGGRIPTENGYRTYVEQLMFEEPIVEEERITVEHQLHQAAGSVDELLPLMSTILASWVGNVAIITRRTEQKRELLQVQLVDISGDTTLLVCVLDDGTVKKKFLTIYPYLSQTLLNQHASVLNELLAGLTSLEIKQLIKSSSDIELSNLISVIADLIVEENMSENTYLDGIEVALQQPEFSDQESMLEAVGYLSIYRLERLINSVMTDGRDLSTRIVIGREDDANISTGWSIVASKYGPNTSRGVIAVVGPTRMAYGYVLPRVRYLAGLITQLNRDSSGKNVLDGLND